MKKITAFLLILSMLFSCAVCAQEDEAKIENDAIKDGKVYLFGDDWANAWGEELKEYFFDESDFVMKTGDGELLSQLDKKSEYAQIKAGDTVILSYGIFEKDRPRDKNDEFKKSLEKITEELTKKKVNVIFASVASTLKYNTITKQATETRNYFTETMKSVARKNNIAYVDLASLTAKKTMEKGETSLYSSAMTLNSDGNRMCAYEIFKQLTSVEELAGKIKFGVKKVYTFGANEKSKVFDLLFETEIGSSFRIYTSNAKNVFVNGIFAGDNKDGITVTAVDGKIDVRFDTCEKIQISPEFIFNALGAQTTESTFTGSVFPGEYAIRVKKSEPLKASVYLNGYLIASNLDMPGTQAVEEPCEHIFKNYRLDEAKFDVRVTGLTDKLDYIAFAPPDEISEKKTRIFVGGDSTLCNYYPLERSGNEADGTVMTGWAMLLEKYIDAEVINLAASGYWAKKWQNENFNIVEKEGKKGDLFILQFGINDKYYSNLEEMKASLQEMIDIAYSKGMIPILVSPQISAGYGWGDEADTGKSDGGDYVEFFNETRLLAEENECFYVDLTDLSSGWFSEIGREAVYKKYHIWDYENDKPGDMMHLSYKGADAMCGFFVHGLTKIIESGKCDKYQNTLALLKIR